MKTDLTHLPEHKQAELKAIRDAIIPRYGEIEMIILFGSYARGNYVEDKYEDKGITYEYKSDYDLLIITTKNAQADSDSLTNSISGKLEELNLPTPVNPIFHGIDFVNKELRDGNYFFDEIKRDGVQIFTSNRYQLDEKQPKSAEEQREKAQKYFDGWFESADGFYTFFEHGMRDGNLKGAAFQLHQATERYLGTIQLVFTGYKPKTHDIEVLSRFAKAVDMEFGKVFPRATIEERRRFTLLRKAYVEARYNMDYNIGKADLEYLSERVQLLKNLTEQICKRKIESFTK
ncbi:hypothetical protein CNR22_19585 [Sphingobacteriaceae bacterium]|nr:hypothetical protein CNR22_19585 [Sphingobacteriaceae bacterium]